MCSLLVCDVNQVKSIKVSDLQIDTNLLNFWETEWHQQFCWNKLVYQPKFASILELKNLVFWIFIISIEPLTVFLLSWAKNIENEIFAEISAIVTQKIVLFLSKWSLASSSKMLSKVPGCQSCWSAMYSSLIK